MIGKSIQLSPEEGLFLISILQTEVSVYGPSKGLGPAEAYCDGAEVHDFPVDVRVC